MKENTTIKTSDICAMSVNRVIDSVSSIMTSSILGNVPFRNLPAVMLWGMPGVGKSQAVRQIAKRVEKETGKRANVVDVRLLLFNPIDLRGIPVADVTHSFAIWLKPKIFDMSESTNEVNILFLDEITAASPSVQSAAYQITLDRVIGEHKLPENCFVICAGNRVTDKSVAYKMPKALANRLCHFEVQSDFQSWLDWAEKNDLDLRVIKFLTRRQDLLVSFDPSKDDVAFATPRSWEMLSNVLKTCDCQDLESFFPIVAGLVGSGIATEFVSWCKVNFKIPDINAIVKGKCFDKPQSTDVTYATIKLMLNYLKNHKDDSIAINNCIEYSKIFSPDFTATFIKELLLWNPNLKHNPLIYMWVAKHAKFFN